jgi:hypothetical protein
VLDAAKKAEFFREGLRRYPDARETVDYFQTSILEAMFAAFEARTNWVNFQPRRDAGNLETGKLIGATDRAIQAWIVGRVGDSPSRVWLSLGLYWKPPRRPNMPVVAACHASGDRGVPLLFTDVPNRPERLHLGPLHRRGESRLFVQAGDDFDAEEAFSLLLDAADEALAMLPNRAADPNG